MRTWPAIIVLCVFYFANPLQAQTREERLTLQIMPGDTGKAVVAAFEFLRAITRDSVVLAHCDAGPLGRDSVPRPRVLVGASSIELPLSVGANAYCRAGAVRQPSGALVILESLSLVRRDVILPYWDQVTFEIRVQLQYGVSSREWQTLIVRAAGARPTGTNLQALGWRVSSWHITGWMSH